jgi:nitrogen-specific signal transduction histidine kinase
MQKDLRHELKTPLTVISGYAQLLQAKLKKESQHKELIWVEKLLEEAKRLEHMIDEEIQ